MNLKLNNKVIILTENFKNTREKSKRLSSDHNSLVTSLDALEYFAFWPLVKDKK